MKKLVRDNIPDIMKSKNQKCKVEVCENENDFNLFLLLKLKEETQELIDSYTSFEPRERMIEEFSDVTDVLAKISEVFKLSYSNDKKIKNGAFDKKYILDMGDDEEK